MRFCFFGALTAGAEEELPLWKVLWNAVYEGLFGTAEVYEHLDMGTGTLLSVRVIIVGMLLGLAVGGFVAAYNKQVLGGFVRTLLHSQCLSPEAGKSLPELDYADKLFIRRAVKKSVSLRRVVRCREEEEFFAKQEEIKDKRAKKRAESFRVDPDAHHFYIPSEMKYMADVKFEGAGTTWRSAIASAILMLVLIPVLLTVLPYILRLLNDFVGMMKG